VKIASPTFYSLRDSRTPVTVSIVSVAANVILSVVLVRVLGYAGLALATALAAVLNAALLLWLLRRRMSGIDGRAVAVAFGKVAVASAIMAVAAMAMSRWLEASLGAEAEWAKAARVFATIGVSLVVLAASARMLRIGELDEALARVLRRVIPGRAGRR
jgi:putative peptidoglycan lipid II flippase